MAQNAWTEGEAYEPFIGRWSRLVAREFISRLAIAYTKIMYLAN